MDKAKFFAQNGLPTDSVIIDGWGEVPIQSLTLDERLSIPERFDKDGNAETSYWIMMKGVVGMDEEDLPSIRRTDPEVISEIVSGILSLSHLGETEVDDAKNV